LDPPVPIFTWDQLGYILDQADRELAGEQVDPLEGVFRDLAEKEFGRRRGEPTGRHVVKAYADIFRKIDRENKTVASFYLRSYSLILGPEISMDILRDHFGPAILKQCLARKRGPTAVQRQDDDRIFAYISAIMWAKGGSTRDACKSLAKMRLLRVRKDAASGRVSVVLDNAETIRKRYLRAKSKYEYYSPRGWLRLLYAWHCSGEPPFLNWLKALIAQENSGPN
jgi:hypothetical protein